MRQLTASEVHERKLGELGVDSSAVSLESTEAIAAALRRTARFLCPCSARTLVRSVVKPLRGLVDDIEATEERVKATLNAIIAHGDILEYSDVNEGPERGVHLLYAAPASFVARQSGAVILLGIPSDQVSALPDHLQARVECTNHLRRVSPAAAGEDLRVDLLDAGFVEITNRRWMKAPSVKTPLQHIADLDKRLDDPQASRDIPGLRLLDPERSPLFYKIRWVEPKAQSGRFVARRSQAYGADMWCYVQLSDGTPERLVDLPIAGSQYRGCDEAWHLQMAIDAQRGKPQRFTIRPSLGDTALVEFFSPVPMWAERRWNSVGELVHLPGCLLAYRLNKAELDEELRFARESLWLEQI